MTKHFLKTFPGCPLPTGWRLDSLCGTPGPRDLVLWSLQTPTMFSPSNPVLLPHTLFIIPGIRLGTSHLSIFVHTAHSSWHVFPQMLPGKHLLIYQSWAEGSSLLWSLFFFPPLNHSPLMDPIGFTIPATISLRSHCTCWLLCLPHETGSSLSTGALSYWSLYLQRASLGPGTEL